MRLAVWSPLPPSPSGIADYVAETLPVLKRLATVEAVVEDPDAVDKEAAAGVPLRRPQDALTVDLHVYHLGNSPAHAYVYRAAIERPGVLVLHDWSLHHLVLAETVERGDRWAYLREMRRAHGEAGSFVGRQVARALGGEIFPAFFPLNDRVLEGSLAVVGLTDYVCERAARRLPDRAVLKLPHHLALPLSPLPSRAEARGSLGLPENALLVTAPGLATSSKRLDVAVRVVGRLRESHPQLSLVIAGGVDPRLPLSRWAREAGLGEHLRVTGRLTLTDFVRHIVAADIVLGLRFPSHGEMSGAIVRALGVGRPVLVTAGTPPSLEFPAGVVVPVDPGAHEDAELEAVLRHLLGDAPLREEIGRLAREYVTPRHGLEPTVKLLVDFLERLGPQESRQRALLAERLPEDGLLSYYLGEIRGAARELGVAGLPISSWPGFRELAEKHS